MVLKGFKLGMALQFAIGPICLLAFRTGSACGFMAALPLVFAVAMVDACYIFLAGAGVGAVINKNNVKKIFKAVGFSVLLLFGLNIIAGAFGRPMLPGLSLLPGKDETNIFLQGVLLTASSPMTILFWSGVFSIQAAMHCLNRKQLVFFGAGCVLSTLVFLAAVAALGCIVKGVIPPAVMIWLNIAVGAMLIFWGIRLLLSKKDYGGKDGQRISNRKKELI